MKKILILFIMFLCVTLISCNNTGYETENEGGQTPNDETILVSRIAETPEGRKYIEVDGEPFNYNGAQIRVDWLVDVQGEEVEGLEIYFEKAAKLGVKMVELPIQWKDVEPRENAYNFRNLSLMLSMAKKYGLKVEILLFTVNIGGMTGCVPDYIKDNKDKYPQYANDLNHPDALFFKLTNENLLESEGLMVKSLMESIYNWSVLNKSNTVISVQVRNEPDLYTKRIKEHNVRKDDGNQLSFDEAWNENIKSIDYIAKIVKASKYQVITRVNLCCYYENPKISHENWHKVVSLESVDLIGEDTYNSQLSFNRNVILNMYKELMDEYNTYPQIAENTGHFMNTASLFLMSNILGCGYSIYDLITPQVIVEEWGYYDWGILNNITKEEKPAFAIAKEILDGINKSGPYMAITNLKDIAGFNLLTDIPKTNIKQVVKTTKTTYEFETTSGALAYAINNGEYIYLFATADCTINISDSTLDSFYETGYVLPNGEFVSEGDYNLTSSKIELSGNLFYRIKVVTYANQISTTLDNLALESNN